jgi:phospholipid/cholesterol/gamma-HCH transport system substrate-binding protein
MNRNLIETITGALVLAVAVIFAFFAYKTADLGIGNKDAYKVNAKFDNVDGLTIGSDIRLAGIKVGVVAKQSIEPESYRAILQLSLEKNIKLPIDSSAQIVSEGLLGGKYIALVPGSEEKLLQPNDEIKFTQSSVNIEQLIGKLMFGSAEKK